MHPLHPLQASPQKLSLNTITHAHSTHKSKPIDPPLGSCVEPQKLHRPGQGMGAERASPLPPVQQNDSQLAPTVHFDLQLGVTLAGAAFEAYLLPTGSTGLQQKSFNGSQITFTDK